MNRSSFLISICLVTVAVASCSEDKKLELGGSCSLNSDCTSPLLCKLGSCRKACVTSVDCDNGGHCVTVDGVSVCQAPTEAACSATATCTPPLVCRNVDNTCRTACPSGSGCGTSQTCTGSVCVDTSELVGGPGNDGSAGAGDGAAGSDVGSGGAAGGTGGPDSGSAGMGDGGTALGGDANRGVDAPATGTGGQTGNSCPSPQTQFNLMVQGDADTLHFQSGLGVRTADELLIFDGYLGPDPMAPAGAAPDAASPSQVYYVYVQAFDTANGQSKGAARPFFKAGDSNTNAITLHTAAIAPTGEIILLYNVPAIGMSAAFLSKSTTDGGVAGLQVNRIVQVEVAPLLSQPDCIWSVASKAFVCSWQYSGSAWAVKVRKFLPDGRSAGGDTDEVPTDRADNYARSNTGDVGTSGNLFGVGYLGYNDGYPRLTVMDKLGNQVGSTIELQQTPASANWVTVAGTSAGFVTFYDQGGVAETLVRVDSSGNVAAATGADAGVLPGFHFTGTKAALGARAINDDVGGVGGVGLALVYSEGVDFAYVSSDGITHLGPGSVISHSRVGGDYINITNFAGSFGVSLYSTAAHSTQMAATGCTP